MLTAGGACAPLSILSKVATTQDGVVVISYNDLLQAPEDLGPSIAKAFGSEPDCLGLVVVDDLPSDFVDLRSNLLTLAYAFAQLDEETRDKYSDASSRYSFGWSHGKEIMNGEPDILKGSYYANIMSPEANPSSVSEEERKKFPEYYGSNIWPDGSEATVEGMCDAFEALGQFVLKVGCRLAEACQPFVAEHMLDSSINLSGLIRGSHTTKARLLHYFPPPDVQASEDENGVNACGYHLDHSMLTGLCSAMYLRKSESGPPINVTSPSPISGLYIKTRGGKLVKALYPPNCLAFQTGEALQIATGGKLMATPHYVRVEAGRGLEPISRETFALFMQPNTDQTIGPGETFGSFSQRIFSEHYEEVQS